MASWIAQHLQSLPAWQFSQLLFVLGWVISTAHEITTTPPRHALTHQTTPRLAYWTTPKSRHKRCYAGIRNVPKAALSRTLLLPFPVSRSYLSNLYKHNLCISLFLRKRLEARCGTDCDEGRLLRATNFIFLLPHPKAPLRLYPAQLSLEVKSQPRPLHTSNPHHAMPNSSLIRRVLTLAIASVLPLVLLRLSGEGVVIQDYLRDHRVPWSNDARTCSTDDLVYGQWYNTTQLSSVIEMTARYRLSVSGVRPLCASTF
jgi:hypothetical protein